MKNENIIKVADSTDIRLLSRLIRESFLDVAKRFDLTLENCPRHPSNCTDEWIENDFNRGVTYYILENESLPIGCVALERASEDLCYLERLSVLSAYRRNGFGRKLVDHVIEQANLFGAKLISIGIIAAHKELKEWYKRIGFVEGETKKFEHLPFLVTFMQYRCKKR